MNDKKIIRLLSILLMFDSILLILYSLNML